MIRSLSVKIDLDDTSITDVPDLIDSAIERCVSQLPSVVRVISTHLVPITCDISHPDNRSAVLEFFH